MKRTFALAGITALLIGLFQFPIASAATTGFSDVSPSHKNHQAITTLQEMSIIGGYPDGTYKPDQVVNRVEALKIILLGAGIDVPETTATLTYTDTDSTQWYAKYLVKAGSLGIVSGYPDKTFRPTQTVNLVESLKMIIEAGGIELPTVMVTDDPYADAYATEWYINYVLYAKTNGWLTPDSQNKIYPDQGITRGALAQLIYEYLADAGKLPVEKPAPEPFVMNVAIDNFSFSPNVLTIAVGTKVKWTNSDAVNHDVTSDTGNFPDSTTLAPGETYEYTFNEIGTFDYHCSLHPTMEGQIIVKPVNEVPTI